MLDTLRLTYEGPHDFIATDRTPRPLKLILSCPEGLPAGAEVRATVTGFRAFTDGGWDVVDVEVVGGRGRIIIGQGMPIHFRDLVMPGVSPGGGQLVGGDHNRVQLCTVIVTGALEPGADMVFSLTAIGPRHARIYPVLEVTARLQGESTFTGISKPIILHNHAGEPERLELRTKPTTDTNGHISGVLFATDTFGNPSPVYEGTFTCSNEANLQKREPGRYVLETKMSNQDKPIRIQVHDTENNLETVGSPIRAAQSGADNPYFGAIHFHTDFSVDGDGKLEDAYAYARDYLNLDVAAVTDHAPLGRQWSETLRINEAFYEPGRFVTIPAWESSTAYGHANIFLKSPATDAAPEYWDPARNPSEVEWPADAVVIPHHPSAGEEPFSREEYRQALSDGLYWTIYDWSIPNPRVRLVEIVQGRGNFEADTPDTYWGIHCGNRGASIQDAFRKGWRLGFTAGTDNHQAYPTQLNGIYIGMTCFLAPELTREAIWTAMDQRNTYATSGVQILCDYSVNGLPMGSEGTLSAAECVHFSAALHGTSPIERVEVISNGKTVWHAEPDDLDVYVEEAVLPSPENGSAYYYLRLKQKDGHRAWLSPVWLDTVD